MAYIKLVAPVQGKFRSKGYKVKNFCKSLIHEATQAIWFRIRRYLKFSLYKPM